MIQSETRQEMEADQSKRRIVQQLAAELQLPESRVKAAAALLDEGNTIPFIARYRKEMTGELDENQLRSIEERLHYLRALEERRREVNRLIAEQEKLTPELQQAVERAERLQEVEDLYRPYRPKRKTRASVAKERGLEPLAEWILEQPQEGSLLAEAAKYVNPDRQVHTAEEALQGAMDIIAERIADDAKVRSWIRKVAFDRGIVRTEAKDESADSVYEMYYSYREPVRKLPPHRILAINRGEREGFLKVVLEAPEDTMVEYIVRSYLKRNRSVVQAFFHTAAEDAYKRLIAPSIEREVRHELTEKAEEHAIKVFAENLRHLLLQPPVRGKVVLGVDPAYRTGCKLAVVDETGKLLETGVIYPTPPHHKIIEAETKLADLVRRYGIDLMVIGNGTASRETEQFIADLIGKIKDRSLQYMIVSEAGASVYSASKLAQEEFPNFDVSERSAVSIARRLQDPLAELVKIDPKSIGVGQYQHDVAQKRLEESLKAVVESAVNHVGVDLNTASPSLLAYVSGINGTLAKNIVKYREECGKFASREQLRQVPRLGEKTFEQCAGFLRISQGDNPLDNTPIHPESYEAVNLLLRELGLENGLLGSQEMKDKLQQLDLQRLAPRIHVGVPTLKDIVDSLRRPGRDPRDELPPPIFRTDVLKLEDLTPGMQLQGTVRNVTDFGAFVDIGVKQDGLVHISQLSDTFIRHPMDVAAVGDTVSVWVLQVDAVKGRVGLTMKKP